MTFQHFLVVFCVQIGEDEFGRLSDEERQRRIDELRRKEKELRDAGKLEEAAALIGETRSSTVPVFVTCCEFEKRFQHLPSRTWTRPTPCWA